MNRLYMVAVLLLGLIVLDETLGAHHKSSKESKKQKKIEGEPREAKKRYSDAAVKQHKRKAREAPVEIEENEEEIEVKELYKSRKESKNEEARAGKYNKKDKTKQKQGEQYVTKEKRKPKEQEGKAYKKTKSEERKPLKRQIVEQDVETEIVENNDEETEGEEILTDSPQTLVEENELEVVTVPNKSCKIKQTVEDDVQEEEPDVLEDEEPSNIEDVPAKKCYYK